MKKSKDVQEGEVEKQVHSVAQQMKHLQNDLTVLLPLLENLDEKSAKNVSKLLSMESEGLLKSLSNLTN